MKKKVLYLLIIMMLLVSLTGCKKKGTKVENGNDVVVSFKEGSNVESITAQNFYDYMKEMYGTYSVINMVDDKLLGLEVADSEDQTKYVNNQIQEWLNTFGSEETLIQAASQQLGVNSMKELKEYVGKTYKQEQVTKEYVKNEVVTEKEIKNYYDQKVFGDMELKLILIDVEASDNNTDEEKAALEEAAYNKAKEAIDKLNNGTSFEDVQKEYNKDDATKDSTVTIKWDDEFDGTLLDAANKLENEKYTTEPVKTSYGYYIVYRVKQGDTPSLEDVQDKIKTKLADGLIEEDKDNLYSVKAALAMREKYGMTINDEEVKNSYDIYTKNQLNPSK